MTDEANQQPPVPRPEIDVRKYKEYSAEDLRIVIAVREKQVQDLLQNLGDAIRLRNFFAEKAMGTKLPATLDEEKKLAAKPPVHEETPR